jgi:phage-related protein
MADLNLAIKIAAETADAERGLGSVQHAVDGLGKVASLAGVALAGGLAAGLGASVSAAAGFEKTMSGVKAVSGATADELANLSGLALKLGKDTSFSASEAAAGIEELVKGGLTIPDIMNGAAEATLNLAAAGGVSLPDAATIAANALAQFNLKGEDMAHVADLIAGAANASALDVSQFKFSLQAAGAVASTVGFSFDDLAQGIAVMGKAGIVGSDAGTSLKTMMLNLIPSTNKTRDLFRELGLETTNLTKAQELAAKSGSKVQDANDPKFWPALNEAIGKNVLGVTDWSKATDKQRKQYDDLLQSSGAVSNAFFDQTGKVKSMAEVADVLQGALSGMNEQQKLATLGTLFGSDAIRAAAVLSKEGAAGFEEMAASMGKVTAASVGAERLNNLSGDIEQFKGSLETAAITFATKFLPVLRDAAKGATSFVNGLIPIVEQQGPQLIDVIQRAGGMLNTFAGFVKDNQAVLVPLGVVLAGAAAGFAALQIATTAAQAIQGARLAVLAMNVALAANPIGLVVVALGALVAGLIYAYNTSEDFRRIVDGAFTLVADTARDLWAAAQPILKGFGEALLGVAAVAQKALSGDISGAFQDVLDFLKDATPRLIAQLGTWGREFVEWIKPQIPPLLEQLGFLLGSLVGWMVSDALPAIGTSLLDWGRAFVAWVADVVPQIPGALAEILTSITGWVSQNGPGIVESAKDIGGSMVSGIVAGLGGLKDAIGGALSTAWESAKTGFLAGLGGGQRGAAVVAPGGAPGGTLAQSTGNAILQAAGLTASQIAAYCGPLAAEAISRAFGQLIDFRDLTQKAIASGWSTMGMGGTGAFQSLLGKMGIGSMLTSSTAEAVTAIAKGLPVAISTGAHYYLATAIDELGRFVVGESGRAMGQATALTLAEMDRASRNLVGTGFQSFVIPTLQRGGAALAGFGDAFAGLMSNVSEVADLGINAVNDFGAAVETVIGDVAAVVIDDRAVETFADKWRMTWDQARQWLEMWGTDANRTFTEDVPEAITISDEAVEVFADRYHMTWDQARQWLEMWGTDANRVLKQEVPSALEETTKGVGTTGTALSALTDRFGISSAAASGLADQTTQLANTLKTTGNPAVDSFAAALAKIPDQAKAAAQAYRDMVSAMDRNAAPSGAGGSLRQNASESGDIGVHSASDGSGNVYTISKSYGQMTAQEKDDANRFARQNPNGLQARAGGGPVTAGVPYLVGELQPEIFVPSQSGTILPNGRSIVPNGRSVTQEIHFHMNGTYLGDDIGLTRRLAQILKPDLDRVAQLVVM